MRRPRLLPRGYLLLFCLGALAGACRTAPPAAAPVSPDPGRVVLFSLDGADSLTLHRLWKEGKLDAGGFSRFFREGQVADGMEPIDPSITAVNHIAIATGRAADETGIVANDIHLPDAPLGKTVSGFSADIGAETLWEAARRQGRRVAVSAWPGADGRNERRRGDWGMTYTGSPETPAAVVDLPRSSWKGALKDGAVPPAGEWSIVPCRSAGSGMPGCHARILENVPGSSTVRVYLGGEYAVRGYPAAFESTLRGDGLIWSGPPDGDRLRETWDGERSGVELETWLEQDERFSTFFADALLAAARFGDWDLLMGYTPVLDEAGHQLLLADPRQPRYTPAFRDELDRARTRIWQAVDRDLARLLDAFDLRTTTVLVVSDHGMAPAHTVLDPDVLLRDWGLLTFDERGKTDAAASRADAVGQGGLCHVYLLPGLAGKERLVEDLRSRFLAWKVDGESPVAQALTRSEAAKIGLDHPNSGDLVLLARPGYHFRDPSEPIGAAPASPSLDVYGKHGYLSTEPAMQAVYMAVGRGVAPKSRGTVKNTEVAAEVSGWLGIDPPRRQVPAPQAPEGR